MLVEGATHTLRLREVRAVEAQAEPLGRSCGVGVGGCGWVVFFSQNVLVANVSLEARSRNEH